MADDTTAGPRDASTDVAPDTGVSVPAPRTTSGVTATTPVTPAPAPTGLL